MMLQVALQIQVLKSLKRISKKVLWLKQLKHPNRSKPKLGLINLIIGPEITVKDLGYIIFENNEFKGPIAKNLNEEFRISQRFIKFKKW